MAGVMFDRRQLIAGVTLAAALPHVAAASPRWMSSGLDAIRNEAATQEIRARVQNQRK